MTTDLSPGLTGSVPEPTQNPATAPRTPGALTAFQLDPEVLALYVGSNERVAIAGEGNQGKLTRLTFSLPVAGQKRSRGA